jgi:lipoprotein-anchoring transpeptidase ErfK/SrfK
MLQALVFVLALTFWFGCSRKDEENVEAKQASQPSVSQLYQQAVSLNKKGEIVKAKELYQQIVNDYPDYENMESTQKELETINMQLILSNVAAPKAVFHEVKPGDTLGKVAKQYGVTVDLIKASNNLQGDMIRLGQKLRIWQGSFNIFVDKSQNVLILKDGDELVKVYNVSTGKNNSTPIGQFIITNKLVDPVWFHRGVVVPPESPANVLGTRWMGFDLAGYGIHGTVEPEAIGQQVTAGCVRMRNEEVEELYKLIPVGTKVVVTD